MAIEKNSFKVSRFDSEFSPYSRDTNTMMSSDDEEFQKKNLSAVESDDDEDDEFDDCDSGAGSDDIDLIEFGESGEEFCQVGDQTCSIPVELYDLSGLGDILSIDVWNEVLTEEDRFSLTQYLPDMDQENFIRTLMELFTGCNLHFGSPIDKLFDMLKGGLCEPRVAMYRQGMNFFQRRQHYHLLRKYQNTMVSNLCQMKDAWLNCKGYSIEEKLQVLNIMKSQKSLMYEKMEELKSDSSEMEGSGDGKWGKKAKDRKHGQKLGQSGYGMGSASDVPSLAMQTAALEPAKPRKQNKKGALKLGGLKTAMKKELAGGFSSAHSGTVPLSQHNRMAGYDSGASFRRGDQMIADDDEGESMYEVSLNRELLASRSGFLSRTGTSKMGKKHEGLGVEEYTDNFMGLRMYSKNKAVNQLSDIKVLTSKPSNARIPYDFGNNMKNFVNYQLHATDDQMRYVKGQMPSLSLKGTEMDTVDVNDRLWLDKEQGGAFPAEQSGKYGDWNVKSKKWKSGRDSSELGISNGLYDSEIQPQAMMERVKESSLQNGGRAVAKYRGVRAFPGNDETESDSSEQIEEDEDDNPLMRSKWAYPSGVSGVKFGRDSRKSKLAKKNAKDGIWTLDGLPQSRPISDFSEHQRMMRNGSPSWRAEQKGKMHDIGQIQSSTNDLNGNYFFPPGRLPADVDWQQFYKTGRNGHNLGDQSGRLHLPAFNAPNLDRRKGELYGVPQSSFQDNDLEDDDSLLIKSLAGNAKVSARLGKKGQAVETYAGSGYHERSGAQLIGCNSVTKKRKVKDEVNYTDERENFNYLHTENQVQVEDTDSSKKRGKRKAGDDTDTFEKVVNEVPVTEMEVEELEPEIKPQKKPFTLITPTFHTGFSFSIIHLLSAVRVAMITLLPDDSSEVRKLLDQSDGTENVKEVQDSGQVSTNGNHPNSDLDVNKSAASSQLNVPSLDVQEIVNRVKTNPGDPSILETQEPLQDLVRGVLKIFSSRTAPLGAKGWKPLVVYERENKSWSWIGPVNQNLSDPEAPADEVTSPDSWGLPHKMLVKLVDSFANWLKNGQETLQQIGSLPAPPVTLTQFNLDEKERFKDLRAQKSLSTISPSSEEVRSYFRKEEVLRYSIPDRAFAYTAFDGKKSIVAPLRRCGGKPTSKARDHFMLKRDRPPHVTILCLVRDAAARLPGSIGTRADVCTLIRDSQYIVEDVSDAQVNQVVSGALDRLHYERDPCVQFDGERKLWVYLHREREEEDFEDDGTSSTKKWKRQRKEANESGEQVSVTVAFPGPGEQTGQEMSSDLNAEPACPDEDKKPEMMPYDAAAADNVEKNAELSEGADDHNAPPIPMVWDPVGLNPMQENRLLCQENSTNEDFDDDIYCREP